MDWQKREVKQGQKLVLEVPAARVVAPAEMDRHKWIQLHRKVVLKGIRAHNHMIRLHKTQQQLNVAREALRIAKMKLEEEMELARQTQARQTQARVVPPLPPT